MEDSNTNDKKAILLAAFGSSTDIGQNTLSAFEKRIRLIFPDIPVRWAFTSGMVRTKLAQQYRKTDSIHKALTRMSFEKFTHVALQPLHIIPGAEYANLVSEAQRATHDCGIHVSIGKPLLQTSEDLKRAVNELLKQIPKERTDESVVFVGHGSLHQGGIAYAELEKSLNEKDPSVFVGSLMGKVDDLLPKLRSAKSQTIILMPLLAVIGHHAEVDMAGNEPHSWKSQLESAGFTCQSILKPTAEYEGFIDIWIEHLSAAIQANK